MEAHDLPSSDPDIQKKSRKPGKKRCCCIGFVIILAALLIPFLINAAFKVGNHLIYSARWRDKGSTSYTMIVDIGGMVPWNGQNVITVEDGKVVEVILPDGSQANDGQVETFQKKYTVEGLFSHTGSCVLNFPFLRCKFEYDKELGYPRTMMIFCPIPDACADSARVIEMQLHPE